MQTLFPKPEYDQITGLILAGGRGRRMQEQDKGLMQFEGRSLAEHVISRLQPQVGNLMISANRNQERYAALGFEVLTDETSDFAGPLAGILAGLKNMRGDWLQCVPCDNPWLPETLVGRLATALAQTRQGLAVPRWQSRLQPVYCLMHRSLTPSLEGYLARDEHKVQGWIAQQAHCVVDFDEIDNFMNINTPEELQQAEQRL